MKQQQELKLLIVYDPAANEYTISDHNLEPQKAEQFISEGQPHLKPGCSFIALDQKRKHTTSDTQNCRACRDQVRDSSGLQSKPKFKRREQ